MNRSLFAALGSALVASMAVGVLSVHWLWSPVIIDTSDLRASLLAVQPTAMEIKLQPPLAGETQGAVELDYIKTSGRRLSRVDLANGGWIDNFSRPLDGTLEFKLEFYANGMLRHATAYGVDGSTLASEVAFRTSGKREMSAQTLAAGVYRTHTYFEDGVSLASEKDVGPLPKSWSKSKVLLKETKWTRDHKLAATNVLNEDESRDITKYDAAGLVTLASHMTHYVKGSTLFGYYPGTKILRVKATSPDYGETDVDMFDETGSLTSQLVISSSSFNITYFDEASKRPLLAQMWFFTRTLEEGITKIKNLQIYTVTQMDAGGQPYQGWSIDTSTHSKLWSMDLYNRTVDGVHWKEVYNFYDRDGLLYRVSFIPEDASGLERKIVDHTAEEGIRSQLPPANFMVPPVLIDDFAIPAPQTGH